MLQLGMKCWYSAFNAQGSILIIVVVQLGAVKIYVAAVEALRKKERHAETQLTTKIDGFLSFHHLLNGNVLFCRFLLNRTLCIPKSGLWCCVFLTLPITLIYIYIYVNKSARPESWFFRSESQYKWALKTLKTYPILSVTFCAGS